MSRNSKRLFERRDRFGIRKLSIGTCSVILGSLILGGQLAYAEDTEMSAATAMTETADDTVIPTTINEEVAMPEYTLKYTAPAADTYIGWEREALPLGNGEIGTKVFGLVGKERIQFNEKTLWSGGPKDNDPNYNGGNFTDKHRYIPEIREALARGDRATAVRLAETHLVGPNNEQYGRYLAFGDIRIDFTNQDKDLNSVTDYHRSLSLNDATSSVEYIQDGTKFKRESFVSFPDNVAVTHLTKEGNKTLDFTVDLSMSTALKDTTATSNFKEGTVTYDDRGALLKGKVRNNGMEFASYLGVDTDGTLTRENNKLKVVGATYATLLMNARTNYAQDPKNGYRKQVDVEAEAKRTVNAALTKKYDAIKADHVKDYQSLFNRVSLKLGNNKDVRPTSNQLSEYTPETGRSLEETFFQYGRYLMITSSRDRQDALPANLQGVWNAVDNPPWASDYHLNVNLQMNYWPVYVANIAETAKPLINFVDDLRHYGRVAAKEYAGIESKPGEENGWLVHTQVTPFGWTTPGWSYYWGWSPSANAWIMQNVYDYYKFTGDKEYLRTKIYPMLKETAKFWNSFLTYDEKSDRYVSNPSYSPEHGTITVGNTYDQSLVWQLFHDYMEAAKELNVDADLVSEVKVKYDKLKPLHINKDGMIKEWFEEDEAGFVSGAQPGHRHASHLVGLYPGTLFSKDTPEYLEAARKSLNDRGDGGTGWSKANKINLWARLLDGDRAHRLLAEQLRGSTLTNLWDTHPPFQIDGNFGATSGIAEMLLQSHTGYIAPLAALPSVWAEGEVRGLVARGNNTVDMKWQNKRLTELKLVSNNGGEVVLDYPDIEGATLLINGKPVTAETVKKDRVRVQTKKGDVLTFARFPEIVTNLRGTRSNPSEVVLDFKAVKDAEYYTISRLTNDSKTPETFTSRTNRFVDKTVRGDDRYTYSVVAHVGDRVTSASERVTVDAHRVLLDDRDPAITYGRVFGNWADVELHGGTEKFADLGQPGNRNATPEDATATLRFTGTGVEIYGLKSNQLGRAFVTIDGQDKGLIDFYKSGGTEKGVLIAKFDGLTNGEHTLKIRVNPEILRRNGERPKISLDYFRILSNAESPTAIYPPKAHDVAANEDILVIDLPESWDKLKFSVNGEASPYVFEYVDDTHVRVGEQIYPLESARRVLIPLEGQDRTNDYLIAVHVEKSGQMSSESIAKIHKHKPVENVTPAPIPGNETDGAVAPGNGTTPEKDKDKDTGGSTETTPDKDKDTGGSTEITPDKDKDTGGSTEITPDKDKDTGGSTEATPDKDKDTGGSTEATPDKDKDTGGSTEATPDKDKDTGGSTETTPDKPKTQNGAGVVSPGLPTYNLEADDDGDGYSNLSELIAGTDLKDKTSTPPKANGWKNLSAEEKSFYDLDADADGDGYSNYVELVLGSKPTDATSVPQPKPMKDETIKSSTTEMPKVTETTKATEEVKKATGVATNTEKSTVSSVSSTAKGDTLPETGEVDAYMIFGAATMAILASVGLVATKKRES